MQKRSKDVDGENKDSVGPAVPGSVATTAGVEAGDGANPTPASPDGASVAQLTAQLADKDKELAELKDKYLRALAETDNVRKRMRQQSEETVRLQRENLLRELLPIVDNLERGLEAARGSTNRQAIVEGVEMVLRSMHDWLRAQGVSPIQAVGQPFDPQVHEAVDHVASGEHPPNTVVNEFHRGYVIGERMLRPARVSVSKGGQADNANGKDNSGAVN
jgi:molecular chaperone GrpE